MDIEQWKVSSSMKKKNSLKKKKEKKPNIESSSITKTMIQDNFDDLKELLDILNNFRHEDRWKIAKILRETGRNLSYAEIKQLCFGKEYNDGMLWQHLKSLTKSKVIKNERKLDFSGSTGKARTSFYSITNRGKAVVDHLTDIIEISKKNRILSNKSE